jgi:hypothetical protein
VASTLTSGGGLSVGASGAIMGLLGALIVLVVLRRGAFHDQWRRMLLWNLAILVAVQILIDFSSPVIDGAAHIGGLVGGAAAALLFAPGLLAGNGRAGRALAHLIAALCVSLSLLSLVAVIRTPVERTLAHLPVKPVQVNGVALVVPRHWEIDAQKQVVGDPYLDVQVAVAPGRLSSPSEDDPRFRELLKRVYASAHAP